MEKGGENDKLKKEVGENDRFTTLQNIFTTFKWNKFTHTFNTFIHCSSRFHPPQRVFKFTDVQGFLHEQAKEARAHDRESPTYLLILSSLSSLRQPSVQILTLHCIVCYFVFFN